VPGQPAPGKWGTGFDAVSDWALVRDGAFYFCRQSIASPANSGVIGRIIYTTPPPPPTPPLAIVITPVPAVGGANLVLTGVIAAVRADDPRLNGRRVRRIPDRPVQLRPSGACAGAWDGLETRTVSAVHPGLYSSPGRVRGSHGRGAPAVPAMSSARCARLALREHRRIPKRSIAASACGCWSTSRRTPWPPHDLHRHRPDRARERRLAAVYSPTTYVDFSRPQHRVAYEKAIADVRAQCGQDTRSSSAASAQRARRRSTARTPRSPPRCWAVPVGDEGAGAQAVETAFATFKTWSRVPAAEPRGVA
jgi:hypothetical protein